MSDLRKAAEMALEAFEILDNRGGLGLDVHKYIRTKIEALRQALAQEPSKQFHDWAVAEHQKALALAQPEQEPVAHLWECIGRWAAMIAQDGKDAELAPPDWLVDAVKAATSPPKREWVGLTHEERFLNDCRTPEEIEYARAIEAKLKEKNA